MEFLHGNIVVRKSTSNVASPNQTNTTAFVESGDSRAITSSVATKNNKRITDQYLSSKQRYYEFKLSWLFLVKINSYTFIFEKISTFSNLGECLLSQNTFSSVSLSNLLNFIKSFFV